MGINKQVYRNGLLTVISVISVVCILGIVFSTALAQQNESASPAEFTLTKTVDKSVASVGEEVQFIMDVTNVGGTVGEFSFRDVLPVGIARLNDILDTAELRPGRSKRFRLYTEIQDDAPEFIENCTVVAYATETLTACATVQVLRPERPVQMKLEKEALPKVVQVGELITFSLTATNIGEHTHDFTLEDPLPDFLEGEDFTESFTLIAGESISFQINARVAENAPDVIMNAATLTSGGHVAVATAPVFVTTPPVVVEPPPVVVQPSPVVVEPPPVVVEPVVPPAAAPATFSITTVALQESVSVGEKAEFTITVANTSNTNGTVSLADPLPVGLIGSDLNLSFDLAANESLDFKFMAVVASDAQDVIVNEACILSSANDTDVQQCATAQFTVARPVVRPDYQQEAFSEIFITYGSEAINTTLSTNIIVGHMPPVGSTYQSGSSRFLGQAIADPSIDDDGRLYWLVDAAEGQISYNVSHIAQLPPVEEPTVTLLTDEREVQLLGYVPIEILEKLNLVQQDIRPTEYFGDIAIVPYQINVGNREDVELDILLPASIASEHDYITLAANLDFADEDAKPLISGYQLLIDEAGKTRLRFEAETTVQELVLQIAYGDVVRTLNLNLLGTDKTFYHYQVSMRVNLLGEDISASGFAQAYAEIPVAGGTLQTAVDVGADYAKDDTDSYAFTTDTNRGLVEKQTPIERFQLTGSGQEAQTSLRSEDGVAVRYDNESFSIGYYGDGGTVPGLASGPDLTALHVESYGDLKFSGFAAMVADSTNTITFDKEGKNGNGRLDGTRTYLIGESVARGSERVTVITVAGEETLQRFKDYSFDYQTGLLTLARPLWYVDENYNPISMRVDYAPATATRDQVAYGAGIEFSPSSSGSSSNSSDANNLSFSAGIMDTQNAKGLEVGVKASFDTDALGLSIGYNTNLVNDSIENSTYTLNAWANDESQDFDATTELTLTDDGLRGKARLGYSITDDGTIVLQHTATSSQDRTDVFYEQYLGDLGLGDLGLGDLGLGAGLGYGWQGEVLNGILRGLYSTDNLNVKLNHAQPFSDGDIALTNLSTTLKIDENLSLDAGLTYEWGNQIIGVLGLDQSIGDANLSLDYQLPNVSGDGNRARFGVAVPFALTENFGVDISAGYDYNFDVGEQHFAIGTGLRYQDEGLTAAIGTEASIPTEGDTKFSVRTGIAGQLGTDHTISLDANYQVSPTLTGRASLSYALKMQRLALLSYHTLVNSSTENTLKGEVSPTFFWADALQVRPSFAYRMDFDDSDADTFQLSLGGTYLFGLNLADWDPTLGVGGYGHYIWQPGTELDAFGASLEFTAKVLDPVWLTMGYTHTDLPGVTDLTEGGLYFGISIQQNFYEQEPTEQQGDK